MEVRIENTSIEYLRATVTTDIDPTSNAVAIAVVATGAEPSGYQTAAWDGTAVAVGEKYRTKCKILVGTGSAIGALAAGRYDVYVKITATPETIVTLADGTLRIY